MTVFVYRCRDCYASSPVTTTVARDSPPPGNRCNHCGGPLEFSRGVLRQLPGETHSRGIADRLGIRKLWSMVGEALHARRTSRDMLEWYRRVLSEESGLVRRDLYEKIVMRRSGVNGRAAGALVRQAEESFCSWPSWRELRFRDVVSYVVVSEYLRTHEMTMGTQTRMGRIVARVIPDNLESETPP